MVEELLIRDFVEAGKITHRTANAMLRCYAREHTERQTEELSFNRFLRSTTPAEFVSTSGVGKTVYQEALSILNGILDAGWPEEFCKPHPHTLH